jgi:hypothetical protein
MLAGGWHPARRGRLHGVRHCWKTERSATPDGQDSEDCLERSLTRQIEELLTKGLGDTSEQLPELGRLGARLVLQRAVDGEVAHS